MGGGGVKTALLREPLYGRAEQGPPFVNIIPTRRWAGGGVKVGVGEEGMLGGGNGGGGGREGRGN